MYIFNIFYIYLTYSHEQLSFLTLMAFQQPHSVSSSMNFVIVSDNKRLQSINTVFPRKNIYIFISTSTSTRACARVWIRARTYFCISAKWEMTKLYTHTHTHTFSLSDINTHHTHTRTNIHRRTHTYIYVCFRI